MRSISLPMTENIARSLKVGDPIGLNGTLITGPDAVHKWMVDTFIKKTRVPQGDDQQVYQAITELLQDGVIYHCGPVVAGFDTQDYRFVAAGPTTSIREEPYQAGRPLEGEGLGLVSIMDHIQLRVANGAKVKFVTPTELGAIYDARNPLPFIAGE